MSKDLTVKKTFSNYMASEAVQFKLKQIIADKTNAARFTTAIISTVVNNPALAECDFNTIFSAALEAESMKLSLSPKLGQSYLIPFNDTKNNRKVATFQIGYKGYIQLAMRSGQYKDIDAIEIKKGEYKGKDSETGKPIIEFIQDDDMRDPLETIGYLAYFELLNGFKKALFWTKEKMTKHATTFSKGFAAQKGYTFWEKSFDDMAFKTVLRQIISKWGVMSIEMQNAFIKDMSIISDEGIEYFDNDNTADIAGKPDVDTPQAKSKTTDTDVEEKQKEEPALAEKNETKKQKEVEEPKEEYFSLQDVLNLEEKSEPLPKVKCFIKSISKTQSAKSGKTIAIIQCISSYSSKSPANAEIRMFTDADFVAGVEYIFINVRSAAVVKGKMVYAADTAMEANDDAIEL